MTGYFFIVSEPNKEHSLYNKLKKTSGVIEVHPVFGEYDFIVKYDDLNAVTEISKVKEISYLKRLDVQE